MKNHLRSFAFFLFFSLVGGVHAQVITMQPVVTFGTNGDGTIRPGDYPFLSSSGQLQRGMAYNPTTGHLLVVDRSTNSSSQNDVYILDGNTGLALTNSDGSFQKLDNSSTLPGGSAGFTLNLVGVADDGSIYVGNLASGETPPKFNLYRWESETASQTFVFNQGNPGNGNTNTDQRRWADTMAVRGSGVNTEVLIANRGTLAAIFTPTDSSLTTFTAKTLTTDAATGGLSVGLTFGAGNSFWTTSGSFGNGPLRLMEYNTVAGTASTVSLFSSAEFPGTVSPILAIPSSNLLVGITMVSGADVVRLYDTSNLESGIKLLDRKSFVTTHNNNNFSGALALGTNGVIYALDSDNGIMAFALTNAAINPLGAVIYQNPSSQTVLVGTNATFTVNADGDAPLSYQWYFGTTPLSGANANSLLLTNVQTSNNGNYSVVVSNSLTVVTSPVAILTVLEVLPGTLLVYDPFPYAVGSAVATSTTAGQGSWLLASGTSATTTSGNLSVPGLAASISNQITWTAGMSLRSVIAPSAIATGSVYFSFAYRLDPTSTIPAAGAGAATVAGLTANTTVTVFGLKINVQAPPSGPGYNVAIYKRGGVLYGAIATNVIPLGDTVFIVGRYTINEAGTTDDTVALWVNPDPATFGAATAPTPSAGDGGIVPASGVAQNDEPIGRFFFRHSSGPSINFADEVRVGQAWADVTPAAPIVATPPTLGVRLSGNTVIISWPSSATGFNLEGTTSLNSPISWSPVNVPVIVDGTNNTVSVSATGENQFFRLKK